MNAPVFIPHPPGAIITEDIVELFFKAFVVIPSLIFISELASPLSLTPRVTDSHELKSIDITDVKHTIRMIEEDTCLSSTLLFVSALVLDDIGASNQEALLVILLELFPEYLVFDLLSDFWGSEVELFRGPTSQIDEGLGHASTIDGLVRSMQLSISLLNEGHPELIRVSTMPIERRLGLWVVWDTSIDNDILPTSILEELEDSETVF